MTKEQEQKVREDFIKSLQIHVDGNMITAYSKRETDAILNYFLPLLSQALDDKVKEVKEKLIERTIAKVSNGFDKVQENTEKDRLYNEMNQNMVVGYNIAIGDIMELIQEEV